MPVNPTGHFFSELCEFVTMALTEIGKAISAMSPAYAACGGAAVADGPLPFGDAIGFIGAAAITIGAAGYGIYQATKAPSTSISKAEEKEKEIAGPTKPKIGSTYYHVTTPENASSIMSSGIMTGSNWEGGYVFAWRNRPNKHAIKNSGASFGTIISFKTNVPFVNDNGIEDPLIQKFGPVKSFLPGPITVWDVQIVG